MKAAQGPASTACWSAGYAGPVIAVPLATYLLHLFGWRAIFYVFGLAGFLWLPLWSKVEPGPEMPAGTSEAVPWRTILRAPSVWALFALHFSSNWFFYFMISRLPTYLSAERHLSLPQMAAGSSLPFLSPGWAQTCLRSFSTERGQASEGRTRANCC